MYVISNVYSVFTLTCFIYIIFINYFSKWMESTIIEKKAHNLHNCQNNPSMKNSKPFLESPLPSEEIPL